MIVIIKGVRPSFVIPLLSPFLEVSITLVISDLPFSLISKPPSPGVTKVLSQRPRPSLSFFSSLRHVCLPSPPTCVMGLGIEPPPLFISGSNSSLFSHESLFFTFLGSEEDITYMKLKIKTCIFHFQSHMK